MSSQDHFMAELNYLKAQYGLHGDGKDAEHYRRELDRLNQPSPSVTETSGSVASVDPLLDILQAPNKHTTLS